MFNNLIRNKLFKPVRNLLRGAASSWPYPVKTTLKNGSGIYVDLRSAVGRGIFVKGEFDKEIGDLILSNLEEGDVFFDIGANVGCYSVLSLSKVGEKGKVFSFEVDPRSLICLYKTKEKFHYRNLIINGFALGEKPDIMGLARSSEAGNTFLDANDNKSFFPVYNLDLFIEFYRLHQPRVIKMDVEGAELLILKGAKKLISEFKPVIITEMNDNLFKRFNYSSKNIIEFLTELGYSYRSLSDTSEPSMLFYPATATSKF